MNNKFNISKIEIKKELLDTVKIIHVTIPETIYKLDDNSEWKLKYIKVRYKTTKRRNNIFLCTYDSKMREVVTDSLNDVISINGETDIEEFEQWINKKCKQFLFESAFK